jgi:hypothetical protein
VGNLLHFDACIGDGDAQADAGHENSVGEIVADKADFLGLDALFGEDLFEDRHLLHMALVDIGHFHLGGPLHCGGGDATANHARLVAIPGQPA